METKLIQAVKTETVYRYFDTAVVCCGCNKMLSKIETIRSVVDVTVMI